MTLLIRGADVVDGTGSPRVRRDVLVDGGIIAAITEPGVTTAADRVIEAEAGQFAKPDYQFRSLIGLANAGNAAS